LTNRRIQKQNRGHTLKDNFENFKQTVDSKAQTMYIMDVQIIGSADNTTFAQRLPYQRDKGEVSNGI